MLGVLGSDAQNMKVQLIHARKVNHIEMKTVIVFEGFFVLFFKYTKGNLMVTNLRLEYSENSWNI